MGQQISAAAESVGSGAASSAGGGGLAYTSTGMSSSDGGGLASMSLGGPPHPGDSSSSSRGDRGESNHLGSPSKHQQQQHPHHQQQQQQQQPGGQTGPSSKTWTPASFDSLRAYPPLPKPSTVPAAQVATSVGNSLDLSAGASRSSDQGDSQQGNEMELGKMSIREAIDSFIERCLHNSNDGGASDNESSEESLNSHHSKASAGNIFALDSSSKRSPSSSCHSPATPSRDNNGAPSSKRDKGRGSGRESRTSRDSGSSSSSPKPVFERGGDAARPLSRQQERGEKMSIDRLDSNGDGSKDGKIDDVVKPTMKSELVMKVDPSLDEGEDTVLVIDCEREDDKDFREKRSPREEEEDDRTSPVKRESVTPKMERTGEVSAKDEPKADFPDVQRVKQECGSDSGTVGTYDSPRQKSMSDKPDDPTSDVTNSPGHQNRSNLLMFELSKKAGTQSSSSPGVDAKSVRPALFLPGPKHLQFIIDRVLDSTLNEGSDSQKARTKLKEEPDGESDKKVSSPVVSDSKVEIIKVEEPVRMESLDLKSGSKEKAEKNLLKEQMAQAKVPVCFKDHIEKVLLESFLSYEEEERKEALKKADNSSHGSNAAADDKGRESGNPDASLSKTLPSPKNAISVQDIVDRVITQTEAINKNMSLPSSASEGSLESHGASRHGGSGAHESSLHQSSSTASRSHTSSSSSAAAEGGYSSSNHYHHHHPPHHHHHHQQQQQQQYSSSQPMSSQDKALQEAQRHVVLKEHQSSTTTGRKRGRPRRVSPSSSNNNNSHPHPPHPHGNSMSDYRLNAVAAGHHYPDERSRAAGHLPHHGPPPLDYNPHGSLSFGLPPGVPGLLPPPGSASLIRQHQHQLEQQRQQQQQQQQQAKDMHGHGLHGSPSGSGGYHPSGSRGHQRDGVPHHMDIHHPRSHMPPHHQQQHPTGSSGSGGGGSSSSSSSSGGGIKPPPPLILAESISPGTRLVPVSHIPTKSCSCHSCVAHFSGGSSSSAAPPPDNSGSPAAQHARLVQHQQSLRPGSGSTRHEGRENSRSPHHLPGHGPHPHPAYGATGPYPVASPPSSSASSRHSMPPSAKDYYNQGHMASRGGECLRPVASMPSRGLPPQAIIPTFVAAQRQQLQREHGPEGLGTSAPSPNQTHQHYSRDGSHPRYYDTKSSSSSSSSSAPSSSAPPSTNSYPHYPPGSHHHGPPPNHHNNPHHPHHHQPQQQQHQQQQQQQQQRHSSPSSQHHKHLDHRYPPEHEPSRGHHPDYIPSSAPGSSASAYHRYDQRSMRDHGPVPSGHSLNSSSSTGRGPPHLPPPGSSTRPLPPPVEPDGDAPLDLSVKPSRKSTEQTGSGNSRSSSETVSSHRTGTSGPHVPPPPVSDADLQQSRAYNRRRSLEISDARSGQYNKHPGDYRDPIPAGHQPHYLQTLENSVDRILPHHHHHHRSPYQGQQHHSQQQQQQQQQQHSHPALPPPHTQQHPHPPPPPPHLRVSVSPHGPRSNPESQHAGGPHPMDHHPDRPAAGYSSGSRPQHSPGQQRGYPPHGYPPTSVQTTSANPAPGMYSHYPLSSSSPSMPHHAHASSHPHHAPAQHPPPPPQPHSAQQHYAPSQSQHQSKSGGSNSSNSNVNSGSSGRGAAPSPSSQSYYNRSPVLGRPHTVSPASAGGPHHYPKQLDSSPHQPYPHAAFPPPQSNSPYQRPSSHNQEGDNSRPSPVNSSHPSAGPPPPLTRRPSDTPSPDEDELDAQGKLNISKHEPIQNIIGNHSPGDILYLICRLCRQTYGNPYGFRKHFRKEHGFEPKGEHTVVQTISATKNAMAHPAALDHMDGSRGVSSGVPPEKSSVNEAPSHPSDHHPHNHQAYPSQHPHAKQEESANKEGSRYYWSDHRNYERLPPSKRSEVLKDQKLLECAECSQTFQLNDFGAYKRHCRQHSGGSGSGPFLCHDCHKCFAEPEQLQEHLNTHADFTPSVCGICLRPFSAPDYLAEHLKAAHGHTTSSGAAGGSSSSSSSAGNPSVEKGDNSGVSSGRSVGERKAGYTPSDGMQSGKSWGPFSQHSHASIVMGTSAVSSGAPVSSSWSSSMSYSTAATSSRRTMAEHGEPQHPVVHTPRDLQIEKLPADPAVMTASPDSSYTDADSQMSKAGPNSSHNVADSGAGSSRQRERDLDSNSSSPSRSRETPSMRPLSSPLAKQSRESSSSQSHTPTSQALPQGKQSGHQSDGAKSKEDNESISSDRCASVDSNSLSFEGSRTSSPAPDETDFSYKHKKYSRYNRKRSTETSSLSGEPGPKSARSSSAESNSAASTPATLSTSTAASSVTTFSTSAPSGPGGKNEHNLSPVVTSSASNPRDCESSTSSSYATQDDPGRSNSPASKTMMDNSGNPGSGKRGDDPQNKKSASLDENHKGNKSSESSKKRKAEDGNLSSEDKSGGKRCSGSDSSGGESGKFKWERMTRRQMGKTSQSVSYSSSN